MLIATRNRPLQFFEALYSVLNQSYTNIEVIVVNDGSDEEHLTQYHDIERNTDNRVKFLYLPKRPNGHGPSFARNTAAYQSTGKFIAFLDDDDLWTDTEHLARFVDTFQSAGQLELYFTNQNAICADGTKAEKPLWLDSLNDSVSKQLTLTPSAVLAKPEWLFSASGFAHLNCTIVDKALFNNVNGFDESLRYEEDKDLFWRLVDNATFIVFDSNYIAQHHIPEKRVSASNALDNLNKREIQLRIAEKNLLIAKNYELKKACKKSIKYSCKHISELFNKKKSFKLAYYYAVRALAIEFNLKWASFTALVFIKMISREK
ncbi:glycosyltransferase [Alishewanella tabrizica]|uniref:glycosyltransferase n=1 Tax=Alishewanella tabrizica TaxID=671278 RepID=UPI00227D8D09|nr:glycosyltransferase [Alishewanella tabrizica]